MTMIEPFDIYWLLSRKKATVPQIASVLLTNFAREPALLLDSDTICLVDFIALITHVLMTYWQA